MFDNFFIHLLNFYKMKKNLTDNYYKTMDKSEFGEFVNKFVCEISESLWNEGITNSMGTYIDSWECKVSLIQNRWVHRLKSL